MARRAGIGEADAQRLYRHVYNAIAHPKGQQDAIDAAGVITPANVTPAPTPADYVNQWKQYAADAQAKRAAANVNRYNERAKTLAVAAESAALKAMLDDAYVAGDIVGSRTVILE